MSNGPFDPPIGKYVLEGRVITMGPQGVLPKGAICVQDGAIQHVLPAAEPSPAGFEDAPHIRTGDTIYPGLIELHNHLSYNAMPLWDVPRPYTNNSQWKNHPDYPRLITKPAQVLGRTPEVAPALVRFVECRSLLGGVTTSQGITLVGAGGLKALYRGLVRNVEDPLGALPPAHTRIANPGTGEGPEYLEDLQGKTCYLQHISEGIDETARGWFHNLQLDDGRWGLTDAFCGIHSTALRSADFAVIQAHGASMVWSPLSNYLLYGDTADIQAARDSGILIGIGCDWAPSGSKNLLGEFKVAWLASQERGGVFTAQEIVEMATVNAARILKWHDQLGTIEPGKRADFLVLNGQQGDDDDYLRLIQARETSITLVVIDGVPRVGQRGLMGRFGYTEAQLDEIRIGTSRRYLYLDQPGVESDIEGLSLTEATAILRAAMHNLPQLARNLDAGAGSGLFSGSLDVGGQHLRVLMDLEEEDAAIDLALAARPFADFVQQPMELDGITVADDPTFLPKLIASRNLPAFVKQGLPPLYGITTPLQPSAEFLEQRRQRPPEDVLATMTDLRTVLRTWGELGVEERKEIVDQALILLERNYVHLPFKRAMHAVDPVQRLRLLRYRLEEAADGTETPEIEFHNELVRTFNSLRDLHTTYLLPSPFRGKVAWLPFVIEEFWEQGQCKYIVSRVVGQPGPASFQPGVEVLYWNGTPIGRVVAQNAERLAGSNPAARHARGLNSLTIRPLSSGLLPDEEWVTLGYADREGNIFEFTQEWLVFEPERAAFNVDPEALGDQRRATATALGMDAQVDEIQATKRILYAGDVVQEERRARTERQVRAISNIDDGLDTVLPTVFRAKQLTTAHGVFGYVRIFTFNVWDADGFVEEFVRLVEQLPSTGLIVDVRGNGGGLIYAAEGLLQALTPQRIEPETAQFINSPINLQICRNHAPSVRYRDLDLSPWISSIEQAVQTGAAYSLAFPITPPRECNDWGQRYYGPVVLITDALCYSATDMFAAGFQDHGIGYLLGASENTGAGGANVWSHAILTDLMKDGGDPAATPSPYAPLPHGADIRVAMRRTLRVRENAGVVLEDLGVRPDEVHQMTRRDVLEKNADLLDKAARWLAAQEPHSIEVVETPRAGALPELTVKTCNVSRLDVWFDGRPVRSVDVQGEVTRLDLQEIAGGLSGPRREFEIQGFAEDKLVAAYRNNLDSPRRTVPQL